MRERISTSFVESTLIGRRERVAFEFERTQWPDEYDDWIYGYMCLWIGGERVGRHNEEIALTVALASFPYILENTGQRIDPCADGNAGRTGLRQHLQRNLRGR